MPRASSRPLLSRMLAIELLFSVAVVAAAAQPKPHPLAQQDTDASWAKAYATSCSDQKHPCPPSTDGYENAFNGDPRLLTLLKHSLPQRESWWVNGYGGSAAVSSIVREFIGVPGALLVDENRYVTAAGCVPHDCPTIGMLWIDTGMRPATVIFVAEVMIEDVKGRDANHLWVYTSALENFEALPPNFLTSLKRWHDSVPTKYSPQTVTVATLVQPNGRMQDITFDTLFYKQNMPVYPKPGAKQ